MSKKTWVNVGGTWKELVSVWENVGGVWKKDVMPKLNVSGVYKECMSYGGLGRLYALCDKNYYELNPDTLAAITSGVSEAYGYSSGMGGISGRLFTARFFSTAYIAELNLDTLAAINTSTVANSTDIGGTANRLFIDDGELNTNSLAIISSAIPNSSNGLGGIDNRLYSSTSDSWHEISLSSLAVINSYDPGLNLHKGTGGINNRLYAGVKLSTSSSSGRVVELNPSTMAILQTVASPVSGELVNGIGGSK